MVNEIKVRLDKSILEEFNNEELSIKLYDENITINENEYHFGLVRIIEPDYSNLESNYIVLIDDELKIKSIKPTTRPLKPFNKENLMIFEEEINKQHDYIIRLFYRMHLPRNWKPEKIHYKQEAQSIESTLSYYAKMFK